AGQVVVVNPEFHVGAFFRAQVRATDGDSVALAGNAIDTVMQVVQVRCPVSFAYAAFQRPVIIGIPYQISARREVTTKCIVVFIAPAQRQGQILTHTPLVFREQCPGFLFEIFIGNAVGHLGVTVLAAHGEQVGIADGGNQFAIENQIGGFKLAVITADDRRKTGVGRADLARNRAAEGFGSAVSNTAVQVTKAQAGAVPKSVLLAFKAQLVSVPVCLRIRGNLTVSIS